jgi:hypothetical protein
MEKVKWICSCLCYPNDEYSLPGFLMYTNIILD